jgi:hypothetical protein
MPEWTWVLIGGLSVAAAWWSWLLRGEIVVSDQGIGRRNGKVLEFIEWSRIGRVRYRRLFGEVLVESQDGRTVRFHDQLQGYTDVCRALAEGAPLHAQSHQDDNMPFTVHASAMAWIVNAGFVAFGIFLSGGGFGALESDPENDWWARPAVGLMGLTAILFGCSRMIRQIEFGPQEIVVRYAFRPTRRWCSKSLVQVERTSMKHKGANLHGLRLNFQDGGSLDIAAQQVNRPIERLAQAIERGYGVQIARR